jgi:hypothetical protein
VALLNHRVYDLAVNVNGLWAIPYTTDKEITIFNVLALIRDFVGVAYMALPFFFAMPTPAYIACAWIFSFHIYSALIVSFEPAAILSATVDLMPMDVIATSSAAVPSIVVSA